ncbi:MAG: hypothetical protein ACJ749_06790 [Flavisolibacter sp.]|jgi:DNA-directed RNA polymerase subunit L
MGRKKIIVTEENGTATISGTSEDITDALKNAAEKLQAVAEEKKRKAIEIRGAKIKSIFCDYSYDHTVAPNTTNSVSVKSEIPAHEDLFNCFRKLVPHLAVICDEISAEDLRDITFIPSIDPVTEKIALFSVSSFKLDDYDAKEGVTITGEKRLKIGDYVSLVTPKIRWDNDKYPFVEELRIAVTELLFEVEEYMKGNKMADNPQQELPFDSGDENYSEDDL